MRSYFVGGIIGVVLGFVFGRLFPLIFTGAGDSHVHIFGYWSDIFFFSVVGLIIGVIAGLLAGRKR